MESSAKRSAHWDARHEFRTLDHIFELAVALNRCGYGPRCWCAGLACCRCIGPPVGSDRGEFGSFERGVSHPRRSAGSEQPHCVYVNDRLAQTKSPRIAPTLINHISSRDQGIIPPTSLSPSRQVRHVQGISNPNGYRHRFAQGSIFNPLFPRITDQISF